MICLLYSFRVIHLFIQKEKNKTFSRGSSRLANAFFTLEGGVRCKMVIWEGHLALVNRQKKKKAALLWFFLFISLIYKYCSYVSNIEQSWKKKEKRRRKVLTRYHFLSFSLSTHFFYHFQDGERSTFAKPTNVRPQPKGARRKRFRSFIRPFIAEGFTRPAKQTSRRNKKRHSHRPLLFPYLEKPRLKRDWLLTDWPTYWLGNWLWV